jgi:hypothetical protein
MTNPPANESIAKRPDILPTISFDFGDKVCLKGVDVLFALALDSSTTSFEMHSLTMTL